MCLAVDSFSQVIKMRYIAHIHASNEGSDDHLLTCAVSPEQSLITNIYCSSRKDSDEQLGM